MAAFMKPYAPQAYAVMRIVFGLLNKGVRLEVDEEGNLANYMIPGKMVPGMGGAMDLVARAKRVVIIMEHAAKSGEPKILNECNLPLTGKSVVHRVITELCVLDVTPEGLVLRELAPGVTVEEIRGKTEPPISVATDLKQIDA